jgi:hypothetical protein
MQTEGTVNAVIQMTRMTRRGPPARAAASDPRHREYENALRATNKAARAEAEHLLTGGQRSLGRGAIPIARRY